MVSGTVGPQCCPAFGGSQSGDPWCSLALPSASAACGSGCPRAAAPSGSTPPSHLSCGTIQEISSNDYTRHQNRGQLRCNPRVQLGDKVWTPVQPCSSLVYNSAIMQSGEPYTFCSGSPEDFLWIQISYSSC